MGPLRCLGASVPKAGAAKQSLNTTFMVFAFCLFFFGKSESLLPNFF